MSGSVSFDRAVDYYDQTRSLPDDLMRQLVGILLEELPGEGRCLEVGVGTGRIALPLIDAGIDLAGVDISTEMLRRLVTKAGRSVKVAIADATHLPFADDTFGSAIASHVLHLIPGWKAAVDEVTRVVEPGGVLLVSRSGDDPHAEWHRELRRHFFVQAGDPAWPPGMSDIKVLDSEMGARGASVRELQDVGSERWVSISEVLDTLDRGILAACWSIEPEVRHHAATVTRKWAQEQFGDVDEKRPVRHTSDWRAYRLPK